MEWKLEQIFASETACDEFAEHLSKSISEFKQNYKGNLATLSTKDFGVCIQKYEDLNEQIAKVGAYSYLKFARDTRLGAQLAKFERICSKLEEKILFFAIEFNELDRKVQSEFMAATPKFRYFLEQIQLRKTHQLSLLEERVLLLCSNTGANAFSRLFDESLARLKFNFRGENLSEEKLLTKLSDTDRSIRKDAANALSEGLEANSHLLTYIYNIIRADLRNDCELRGYKNAEDFRHLDNQITKKSVDALIFAAENSFNLVEKFYEKKRQILGLEELYDYDRYAPLGDDKNYSFDEAKKIVLDAYCEFSPEFKRIAEFGLQNNWCDAMSTDFKESGAFSHSATSDIHPFVLLNFTGKRRDIYTMAHEFGHAIHQFLSYKVGFLNSQTPLTTAETASVFCEMLVFEKIKNSASKDERRAILANKIEDIFATLYRQINFTTFERKIHAEKGELSAEEIGEIWLKESRKMFGKSLALNEYYRFWWSYIPHFFHTPFYCYSYGYAQLLVLALYGLYKSEKLPNFVQIYTNFLSLGGSKNPKDMVAAFGLDIESTEFWQIGINEIKKLVDEFDKI